MCQGDGSDFDLTWRAGPIDHFSLMFFLSRIEMARERPLIAIFDVLEALFHTVG